MSPFGERQIKHRSHLSSRERQVRSKLAKLAHQADLLCGSLVHMARKCGKPNCKCAAGELHRSLYLSIKVDGKRKMIYVPRRLEQSVRAAVKQYQNLKELVRELSDIHVERFLESKQEPPP